MKNLEKAYEILDKVMNEQAYASLLLKNVDDSYNVGFITQLVYGTLRNFRISRDGWRQFTKNDLDPKISTLLDLGIYMLNDIKNTPDYAIVNNVVELSKSIEYGKYSKLCNAVLKKYIREEKREFDENSLEDLSIKYSNPLWLTNLWKAHYGIDRTKEILKHNLEDSKVTLRTNVHKISVEDLLALDSKFSKGSLAPEEVYYAGNIFATNYFKDGLVSVQDGASQLVAHAVKAEPTDLVLDTCSAPGTKATHIAALRNDQGSIDAIEVYPHRADLITSDLSRLNLNSIKVYTHDARMMEHILEENHYDKVLVDAPCTGFGVMRGKPEIKFNSTPEDIDEIILIQRDILNSAAKMVKDGGLLIYSTCTLNKKENEAQVKVFLTKHLNFELVKEETIFGYEHNSDSFYMAVLKKLK